MGQGGFSIAFQKVWDIGRRFKERCGSKGWNLLRKAALYNLSSAYKGTVVYSKLDETESVVLQEFERFLDEEHSIKLELLKPLITREIA